MCSRPRGSSDRSLEFRPAPYHVRAYAGLLEKQVVHADEEGRGSRGVRPEALSTRPRNGRRQLASARGLVSFSHRPWRTPKNREAHREAEGRGPQEGSGRAFPRAGKPVRARRVVRVPRCDGAVDVRPSRVGDARHLPADRRPRSREWRPQPGLLDACADHARGLAAVRDRRLGRRPAASVAQVRPRLVLSGLKPDFKRVSPAKGAKRIASPHSIVELVKSVAKLSVVSGVVLATLWPRKDDLASLGALQPAAEMTFVGHLVLDARVAGARHDRRDRHRRRGLVEVQPREVAEDEQGRGQAGAQAAGHVARR